MKNFLASLLLFLVFSFAPVASIGQEMVQMMDGNKLFVTLVDTSGKIIKVEDPDPPKRKKNAAEKAIVSFEKERVFPVTYRTGEEVVYYRQDTTSQEDDNLLTIDEMRSYLAGVHDAKNRYKSPGAFWACFATGVASGLTLPLLLSPLVPVGMTYFMGTRWIKVNREHISDPKYLKDEFYIMGYERTARSMRVQGSLGGTLSGLFVGILASTTLFNENLTSE
jgi:hypothetical protein